ncbi:DUF222 domain-containing protein [Lysinimonas soli]|uniref:DUF222 domain-containing protein n=1 Tax=Lysinimonas soli TaxID=1074233 RepID=A0ABW0NMY8_9MICO
MSAPAFHEFSVSTARALSDSDLMQAQRAVAEVRRRVDASAAVLAAELAYRSRRDLGYEGLAQKLGARTPEKLVQRLTGSTAREAHVMVRVGALMSEESPLGAVGVAVTEGALSVDAAGAIQAGLGALDGVPVEKVADAARELLVQTEVLTVEQLAARARELAAELDEHRVADREERLREQRYLRLSRQSDGMTRLTGLLDPESAATVAAAFDAATSPRRGGPRFVDPTAAAHAEELLRDPRTTEQIGLDAIVELLRIGVAADPATVVGARQPAVQVLIAERDLRRRSGVGAIEGQAALIGIDTVERHVCEGGVVPVLFDSDGQVVNVGREQRRFTRRQRIGLAARDGGCRFPECDRPPAWCEAHHIEEWHRDHGRTDIADGVLLCRFHHLLVHNNGWKVNRSRGDYSIVPPRSADPSQRPIPAPPNSVVARRLLTG